MNLNAGTIIITLIVMLAIPYLGIVIRKVQNHSIPFLKALNPFYTKEKNEAAQLKASLSPIMKEIETQDMAKFIKRWTAKFENGTLSEQDVIALNAKLEAGRADQVKGILSLHPEAEHQFQQLSEQLKKDAVRAEQEAEILA
jgi:hypothetical protein